MSECFHVACVLQGAIDLVQMRQQAVDVAVLRQELHRYRRFYHPPKLLLGSSPIDGEACYRRAHRSCRSSLRTIKDPSRSHSEARRGACNRPVSGAVLLAGVRRLAAACDSYQWSDEGATVLLSVPLPNGIPTVTARDAVQCCFQRSALAVTMTGATATQQVLRLQPLYAPVLPQRCSWRLHSGTKVPQQKVASTGAAMAGAIVVAGTETWAVRITLCKENPSVTWNSLVFNGPPSR